MERDTVHLCMFLAYLFIGFVKSDYVLENINSCDDNCVIIIVDSLPQAINSTINVLPRKNQSLHVSSFNKVTVNVSIGDVRIGSSNVTFENLTLFVGKA